MTIIGSGQTVVIDGVGGHGMFVDDNAQSAASVAMRVRNVAVIEEDQGQGVVSIRSSQFDDLDIEGDIVVR